MVSCGTGRGAHSFLFFHEITSHMFDLKGLCSNVVRTITNDSHACFQLQPSTPFEKALLILG